MQIIRDIKNYIAYSEADLSFALQKISQNQRGFIFSVSENGLLEGVMTDGDFRRYLLSVQKAELNVPLSRIARSTYISASIDDVFEDIAKKMSDRIRFIPLVDAKNHLVAIATDHREGFKIGPFHIDDHSKVFVIAEIGINHNGDVHLAKRMICKAKESGADCVKFQMRDLKTLYRNHGNSQNNMKEDLGAQYILDIITKFQLSNDDMFRLFDFCREIDILPLCTPWDNSSLQELEHYGMPAYKIASADLTHHELLRAVAKTGKPLICSTGMSQENEIKQAVKIFNSYGASFCLLHCNSTYPAPFKDIHLNYMARLKKIGDCPIGYSGHERGIYIPIAAVAKGAKVIEKHFTFDRQMEGNDHKVSLLPEEFAQMVEGIRQTEEAMGQGDARYVSQGELMNRENLAKSIVAKTSLRMGEVITADKIDFKSPGRGLQPNRISELIGKTCKRALNQGDFFFEGDLNADVASARKFSFKRPWGVPVRYHDFNSIWTQSNPDFLEFHFSYKDLDLNESDFFREPMDIGLVVHSPDLFKGDHLLNFAEPDLRIRQRSIAELQKVVDVALRMKPFFKKCEKVPIIVSLGGFTKDKHLDKSQRAELYKLVAEALSAIQSEGVEILPQTLPPFPWYFGGQLYCNLFVEAEDIVEFCQTYGYRVCLDISHSKLACNYYKKSFNEFVKAVAPYSGHLHIVDAKGDDGEGIQIGEGEIDFPLFSETINKIIPKVSFIPEIWQGHKNGGEGFWVALQRLEKWL